LETQRVFERRQAKANDPLLRKPMIYEAGAGKADQYLG